MDKIIFIVNPFSGTTNKSDFKSIVESTLETTHFSPIIRYTEYAGHGNILASEAVHDGIDTVVAVGGDGTVNEVAQALVGTDTNLGIIPAGSGNGFSRHLHIPIHTKRAIEVINKKDITKVDTCSVNDHFFINVAGIGFDAKIAYLTKHNNQRGFLPYFKATMKESLNVEHADLEIYADDQVIKGRYISAIVANASRYGYQFTVAPKADIMDGIFDITLIKEAPVYRYFMSAYRFLNKTVDRSRLVDTVKASKITIKSKKPIHFHVDGEAIAPTDSYHFVMNPQSLKVISGPL